MKNSNIGELEEMVLLSVGSLYDNAYALTILESLKENANRNPDVTAIHSVLRRLEKKGYVKSGMGGATAERGGRRKRFFTLTQAGRSVLEEIREVRNNYYMKLPKLTFSSIG